jgi:hypothetical protein
MLSVSIGLLLLIAALLSIKYLFDRARDKEHDRLPDRDRGERRLDKKREQVSGKEASRRDEKSNSHSRPPYNNRGLVNSRVAENTRGSAKKYRAVGVRHKLDACRAVLAFEHKRFLAEEAPHFPVRGCDAKVCQCQYIYYPDRRDEERRSPFGAARNWAPAGEGDRREHRDRRQSVF